MNWRLERVLFLTHTPDAFEKGDITTRDGAHYRITRLVRLAPTSLLFGGSYPCYEVRGRKMKEEKRHEDIKVTPDY